MNTSKRLKITSVCMAVISAVFYGIVLFGYLSFNDDDYHWAVLRCAQALLILAFVFAVFSIIAHKEIIGVKSVKKILFAVSAVIAIGCSACIAFSYATMFNYFTPEKFNQNKDAYQQYFPFHDVSEIDGEFADMYISHISGTDYIELCCYGMYPSDSDLDYEVEYFESTSPLANFKFRFDRSVYMPFNSFDMDVIAVGKKAETDGVKYTAFVDEDDYAILIKAFGRSIYASLKNAKTENISLEDFARTVIGQFDLLQQAVKEKSFS